MDTRRRGNDVGYFKVPPGQTPQQAHDFDKLPAEFEFVLICGGSGTWIEPAIDWYISECERTNRKWGLWFFAYAHLTPKEQVAQWLKQPKSPHFPACYDYEFSRSRKTIPSAAQLKEGVERLEQAEGRPGMIYTRKNLVDAHLQSLSPTWLNSRWWYLAQYLAMQELRGEHPGPVDIPSRVMAERVIVHQTADKLPPPAGFYSKAKSMDYDRWVGVMSLEEFTGAKPPTPTLEQRVAILEREARAHGWQIQT